MGTSFVRWSVLLIGYLPAVVMGCEPQETPPQVTPGGRPEVAKPDGYATCRGERYSLRFTDDYYAFQGTREILEKDRPEIDSLFEADGASQESQLQQYGSEGVRFGRSTKSWKEFSSEARKVSGVSHVGMAARLDVGNRELPEEKRPVVVVLPEFVVRFKPGLDPKVIEAENEEYKPRQVAYAPNQYVFTAESPSAALKLCDKFRSIKDQVVFAEPNLIRHVEIRQLQTAQADLEPTEPPNDALVQQGLQWHLDNWGTDSGSEGADVRALQAWSITRGDPGVVIAVIDPKGIDVKHPDLKRRRHKNGGEIGKDSQGQGKSTNGKDDDSNGYIDDVSGWNFATSSNALIASQASGDQLRPGTDKTSQAAPYSPTAVEAHGTAVAGLAVASQDNEIGVSGIAPECKLLGITLGITDYDVAQAFYYAADRGADVIACGWGYPTGTPVPRLVEDAIAKVTREGRNGLGCVVVFAMTNEEIDNTQNKDISSNPDVISVGCSTNIVH